jgi:hypothetical protein
VSQQAYAVRELKGLGLGNSHPEVQSQVQVRFSGVYQPRGGGLPSPGHTQCNKAIGEGVTAKGCLQGCWLIG